MTIPTYPIEPRNYEAEHEFVGHFGRMFKNLVRQYMTSYPATEQQHDLLAQMQDRTSCYAPYVWSDQQSAIPQGEPLEVTGQPAVDLQKQALYAARYEWLRQQHWFSGAMAVVMNPKQSVVLGSSCPFMDLLDAAIDEARLGKPDGSTS